MTEPNEYQPDESGTAILKDLALCQNKRNPARDPKSISSRTRLKLADVESELAELEKHGYVGTSDSGRRHATIYSIVQKGSMYVIGNSQAEQEEPLESVDLKILQLAAQSKFGGSIKPSYVYSNIRGEDTVFLDTRLELLHKMGLLDHPLPFYGGPNGKVETYVINESGRARLERELSPHQHLPQAPMPTFPVTTDKMQPAVPAQPAEQPTVEKEQKAEPTSVLPTPDYLEAAIGDFESALSSEIPGSPNYTKTMGKLLLATAKKVREIENRGPEEKPTEVAAEKQKNRREYHETAILKACLKASETEEYVLDSHIMPIYAALCKENGQEPLQLNGFKKRLKKLAGNDLLRAERKGSRALGRKGRGFKTVYYPTDEGKKSAA